MEGATTCTSCDAGYFSLSASTECSSCLPGKSSLSGQPLCQPCEGGRFSGANASSSCSECAAGRFSSSEGATSCSLCSAGTFQGASGQQKCEPCGTGKFAAAAASSSCSECPIGQDAAPGSPMCDLAAPGYFLGIGGVSTLCPSNAECSGHGQIPRPMRDFWVGSLEQRSLKYMHKIYPCYRGTCTGMSKDSAFIDCWTQTSVLSPSTACDSDALLCEDGARGPLCASCIENYVYSTTLDTCRPCSTSLPRAVTMLGAGCVVLFIGAALRSGTLEMPAFVADSVVVGTLRNVDAGAIRCLWTTYQIVSSCSWSLGVQFPKPYGTITGFLSLFSFDLGLECLPFGSTDHLTSVKIWVVVPVALVSVNMLVWASRRALCSREKDDASTLFEDHLTFALFLTYLVLPPVSFKLFQALDCVHVVGEDYLRVDTSIDCSSAQYRQFRVLCISFIALYLSLPLLWLVLLHRKRHRLNPRPSDRELAYFLRGKDAGLRPLRFLFAIYAPGSWFMEPLEILRRVLFIGVVPLLSTDAAKRSLWGTLLALGSLTFYHHAEPYRLISTNFLAFVCQYVLLFTYGAALVIGAGVADSLNSFAIGLLLVVLNFGVLAVALYLSSKRYLRQREEHRKRLRRRATRVEDATGFSAEKFQTTFHAVDMNHVVPSHCLVFWYGKHGDAESAIKSGIPAQKHGGKAGVLFTFHRPHDMVDADARAFPGAEVVLACSIPRCLLHELPTGTFGEDEPTPFIRILPGNVLRAVRGSFFADLGDAEPWNEGFVFLPPQQILRAFSIKSSKDSGSPPKKGRHSKNGQRSRSLQDVPSVGTHAPEIKALATCHEFVESMKRIRQTCSDNGWVPLYHYTSPAVGNLIRNGGFRMSTQGQGDGGVYFSTLGPASYNLGSVLYEDNIISDCFGPGRLEEYRGQHKLDLCFVYGAEPMALTQAPGGRDNAKMVSKATFESLSMPDGDGNYFLRPDRILGCFLLDPSDPPANYAASKEALREESRMDTSTREKLAGAQLDAALEERQVQLLLQNTGNLKEGPRLDVAQADEISSKQQRSGNLEEADGLHVISDVEHSPFGGPARQFDRFEQMHFKREPPSQLERSTEPPKALRHYTCDEFLAEIHLGEFYVKLEAEFGSKLSVEDICQSTFSDEVLQGVGMHKTQIHRLRRKIRKYNDEVVGGLEGMKLPADSKEIAATDEQHLNYEDGSMGLML